MRKNKICALQHAINKVVLDWCCSMVIIIQKSPLFYLRVKMKEYHGSCHCGGVCFSFSGAEIVRGLKCNCSICLRKGAIMTDYLLDPSALHYEAKNNCLATYQFGSQVAKHYFCNKCGIYTFHESLRNPGHFRINIGCIAEILIVA
jgi:hypothetical protein